MGHTASRSGTSVTSLEGLLVAALAEVISAAVHDNGALNPSVTVFFYMAARGDDLRQ